MSLTLLAQSFDLAGAMRDGVGQALTQLWPIVGLVCAVAFLRAVLSTPRFKGAVGECAVRTALLGKLDYRTYHCIDDVLLRTAQGTLTQIDHVVMCRFGIFVIETKNCGGWIFGGEKDRYWTVTYGRRNKQRMLNPLYQNHGHVQAIEHLLNLPANSVRGIVFFIGEAKFKYGPVPGVLQSGLVDYIRSFDMPVFSDAAVASFHRQLAEASLSRDKQARAEHLEHVRKRQNARHPASTNV